MASRHLSHRLMVSKSALLCAALIIMAMTVAPARAHKRDTLWNSDSSDGPASPWTLPPAEPMGEDGLSSDYDGGDDAPAPFTGSTYQADFSSVDDAEDTVGRDAAAATGEFLNSSIDTLRSQHALLAFPVCPNAGWVSMIFARNPVDILKFIPLPQWGYDQIYDYFKNEVALRAVMSLVFLGLSVAVAIGFVLWRIVKFIALPFCGRCEGQMSTQTVLRGAGVITTKVLILMISAGAIGVGIYALTINQNAEPTASNGWDVVQQVKDYANKILDELDNVLGAVQDISAQSSSAMLFVYNAAVSESTALIRNLLLQMSERLGEVMQEASDIAVSMQSGVQNARDDVVTFIETTSNDWEEDSLNWWNIVVKTCMGAFIASVVLPVLLLFFMVINYAWGIGIMICLQLVLVIFMFAAAAVYSGGLVTLADGCKNLETIIVQFAPDQLKNVTRYYTTQTSDSADLEQQLKDSGLVDVEEVRQMVQERLSEGLRAVSTYILLLSNEKQALVRSMFQTMQNSSESALTAVEETLRISDVTLVQPIYDSTKQYLCCEVPGIAEQYWIMMTVLGWLGLAIVVLAMILLGLLDRRQDSGMCCSCSCVLPTRMPAAGKPVDGNAGDDDDYAMGFGAGATDGFVRVMDNPSAAPDTAGGMSRAR
uniref:Plasma membrane fusion protein PRM1 n=1 Tax=Chlamydomonas euryale TaxID=1486919 RepID=A0A7R9YQD7_9CHLO